VRLRARAALIPAGVILLALPPTGEVPGAAQGASERPNVLIIMTDDQRADTLGVMKRTQRWFFSEGTQYPHAFATTPLCCPSRASIMTGQYSHNTNVETNIDAARLDQRATMQRYLQDAGYRTAIVGKYLNDWTGDPPYFHDWAIFTKGGAGYRDTRLNVNGASRRVKRYSTDWIAARAARLLRSFEGQDPEPWFLLVTPFAPHDPYEPERAYMKTRVPRWQRGPAVGEEDLSDKPTWIVEKKKKKIKEIRRLRAAQLRMLLSVDDLVAKLMRELSRLGEQDTLAVFMSDNGFFWGEHTLVQKQAPYTAAVQLPMMLRWPGHLPGAGVDLRPAANVDIAPTVYDAVGITPDPDFPVDGRSLLQPNEREFVLLEFRRRIYKAVPTWASLRTPTYQYTEWYDEDLQQVIFREYYDLVADPYQLTNLLGDQDPGNDPPPQELTRLTLALSQARRCEGSEGGTACP
jgi:arylsulfatase A-like enzyme